MHWKNHIHQREEMIRDILDQLYAAICGKSKFRDVIGIWSLLSIFSFNVECMQKVEIWVFFHPLQ